MAAGHEGQGIPKPPLLNALACRAVPCNKQAVVPSSFKSWLCSAFPSQLDCCITSCLPMQINLFKKLTQQLQVAVQLPCQLVPYFSIKVITKNLLQSSPSSSRSRSTSPASRRLLRRTRRPMAAAPPSSSSTEPTECMRSSAGACV